jgi:CRISPR-associated protein Csd2
MSVLKNKIDFAVIVSVKNANPNGDPLNGNRPREDYDGFGEISDVCIKRKIRNRFIDLSKEDSSIKLFVQSDDKTVEGFKSLRERADSVEELKAAEKKKDPEAFAKIACETWIDVRSFGQVFAFKGSDVSIGVRGPVSIHPAFSVVPIDIQSIQITKSVNSVPGEKKGPDTMGTKHRVPFGLYVFYGSINCQLAELTGFSEEDADRILWALRSLFVNDASSARPEGSMEVCKVYWWKHKNKNGQYSSAKVHRSLKVKAKTDTPRNLEDYSIELEHLEGLEPEIYDELV